MARIIDGALEAERERLSFVPCAALLERLANHADFITFTFETDDEVYTHLSSIGNDRDEARKLAAYIRNESDDTCPICGQPEPGHKVYFECPVKFDDIEMETTALSSCGHPTSSTVRFADAAWCEACSREAKEWSDGYESGVMEGQIRERERLYGRRLPDDFPDLLEEFAAKLHTAMVIMYGKDPAEIDDATISLTLDKIEAARRIAAAIRASDGSGECS